MLLLAAWIKIGMDSGFHPQTARAVPE